MRCSVCHQEGHRSDNRKFHPKPDTSELRNEVVTNDRSINTSTFAEYIGHDRIKARGFWKKRNKLIRENILLWVKWFENKYCIVDKEKWYKVTGQMINENGGRGFFTAKAENSFKESVLAFVKFIYPDIIWKPYLFTQPPQRFWKTKENRKLWFEDFCEEQSFCTDIDCYRITSSMIESSRLGMGPLASFYEYSIFRMIQDLRPDFEWLPWRFDGQVPKNYWKEHGNVMRWFQIEILEPNHLLNDLGEIQYESLYQFTTQRIHDAYGQGVLVHKFNGSVLELYQYLFPSYNWQFWKFVSAPNNAWDDLDNIKKYLKEELGVKSPEDLYNFTLSDMPGSLFKYESLHNLCKLLYPDLVWERERFRIWGFSRKACRFMDRLSVAISQPICHALNGHEHKLPGTNFKADGYFEIGTEKYVIEYHGCYYHGCCHCYQHENRKKVSMNGKTHEENYVRTCERTKMLRDLGFHVVEMWECQENCEDLLTWWTAQTLTPPTSEV